MIVITASRILDLILAAEEDLADAEDWGAYDLANGIRWHIANLEAEAEIFFRQ